MTDVGPIVDLGYRLITILVLLSLTMLMMMIIIIKHNNNAVIVHGILAIFNKININSKFEKHQSFQQLVYRLTVLTVD